MNQLEQLALVHDGTEGAVHQTHAAVHALVVVDVRPSVLILSDGVHALILVDDGLTPLRGDGPLGAGVLTVPRQTALACAGHLVVGGRAGIAGVLDDVDQRGIVVLRGNGTLLHAVGQHRVLRHRPQRQAHGQPDALTHDGPLQKHGLPLPPHLAGHDLIGQLLHARVVSTLIGQLRHLGKDPLADVRNTALDISHSFLSSQNPP